MEAMQSSEQIFEFLFSEDDISWKTMIYDLVKTEQMDPWDIDIGVISKKFLDKLKQFKEMNFRISGKVILAASILLKLKSERLVEEDIGNLDALIASGETHDTDDALFDDQGEFIGESLNLEDKPRIVPRTPQPRKRKVSVFDLIEALEKALEVKNRRKVFLNNAPMVRAPDKPRDITLVIRDLYKRIAKHFKQSNKKLTFNLLLPSQSKQDKVQTFIPLLHLDNQRIIDLLQEAHFSEIEIKLLKDIDVL
jgi:segregation and condensation protein A